jgi:hypothetical protein
MSMMDKIKDRMEKFKTEAEDAIRNKTADINVRSYRLHLCNTCEFLFEPTGNCTKCGCFVKGKTWVKNSKCPIGKW